MTEEFEGEKTGKREHWNERLIVNKSIRNFKTEFCMRGGKLNEMDRNRDKDIQVYRNSSHTPKKKIHFHRAHSIEQNRLRINEI